MIPSDSIAELGDFLLERKVEFLQVGGGRFVTLLCRHNAKVTGLVEKPVRLLAVTECYFAAYDGTGSRDLIHSQRHFLTDG
jgi:hypothetical protein